jgi:O-antigen/teichoic acid export membrane protein
VGPIAAVAQPGEVSARFRRLGREAVWVVSGQALAAVGALAGVRLMTGLLPPATYGELALGVTAATLVTMVALSPLTGAFLRFFSPAQEAGELRAYLAASRALLRRALVAVGVAAALACVALLAAGQARHVPIALAALAFALASGVALLLDAFQNAARQRAVVAWHDALSQWIRFAGGALLVWAVAPRSWVAMLGYALGAALVLASQWLFFRRGILRQAAAAPAATEARVGHWARQMGGFARPFALWGLFTWALAASDRWALQGFASTRSVGLYAVLYQIGYYPISMLTGLVLQLVAPILYGRAGDGSDAGRVSRAFRLNAWLVGVALALAAVGTLLAALLHHWVFRLFVAPEYREVSRYLPWMVLAGGLFAAGQVAAQLLLTSLRARDLIAPKVVTALVGVALNLVGAYYWGMPGVLAGVVAYGLLHLAWIVFVGRRELSAAGLYGP